MVWKARSIRQRLEYYRKIDPITGCWLWTGYKDKRGRGSMTVIENGKKHPVSVCRLSYEEFTGKKLSGMCCHKLECHNSTCFNPDHLYDGDNSNNQRDRYLQTGMWKNQEKIYI